MKKLIILSVLAVAACSESRGVHGDWSQGAHFGPSSRAEFRARAERGEPGVFPAPSGYSIYAAKNIDPDTGTRVVRQGTASSRTGEYSGPGRVANGATLTSGTSTRNSPYRANALVAAREAKGRGKKVTIGNTALQVDKIDVGANSYAVFRKGSALFSSGFLDASSGPTMEAALPTLTGCTSVAGPFIIGPGGKVNTHMVYALNCG